MSWPRLIWSGHEAPSYGKDPVPVRIVAKLNHTDSPHEIVIETAQKDAMGELAWSATYDDYIRERVVTHALIGLKQAKEDLASANKMLRDELNERTKD